MKGYFSSLIQQTGINIGRADDSKPNPSKISQKGLNESSDAIPPHLEEERFIEPSLNQGIGQSYTGESESSQEDPAEKSTEEHITKVSKGKDLIEGKTLAEDQRLKESRFKVSDFAQEKWLEKKEGLEQAKQVPGLQGAQEGPARKGEKLANVGQEIFKNSTFKRKENSDDQILNEQNKQVTLNDIRQWVAVTPEPEEIEQNKALEGITSQIVGERFVGENSDRNAYSNKTSGKQKEALEVQNNQISIGTIQLTIEEPSINLSSQLSKQKKKKNGRNNKENYSSRLSRNYIRIR